MIGAMAAAPAPLASFAPADMSSGWSLETKNLCNIGRFEGLAGLASPGEAGTDAVRLQDVSACRPLAWACLLCGHGAQPCASGSFRSRLGDRGARRVDGDLVGD